MDSADDSAHVPHPPSLDASRSVSSLFCLAPFLVLSVAQSKSTVVNSPALSINLSLHERDLFFYVFLCQIPPLLSLFISGCLTHTC